MYIQMERPKTNKSKTVANFIAQKTGNQMHEIKFVDTRHETIFPKKLQERNLSRHNSKCVIQLMTMSEWIDQNTPKSFEVKHLALSRESGQNKAAERLKNSGTQSTVLIVNNSEHRDKLKSLKLNKSTRYTIKDIHMVIASMSGIKYGFGNVTIDTDDNAKLYHLHSSDITDVRE